MNDIRTHRIIALERGIFVLAFALLLFSRHIVPALTDDRLAVFEWLRLHSGDFNWVIAANILFRIRGAMIAAGVLTLQELGLLAGGTADPMDLAAVIAALILSVFFETHKRKVNAPGMWSQALRQMLGM